MNKINNNVEMLLDKYGDLDDIRLCLLYWQQIDQVEMNKEFISTKPVLNATSPKSILDAKRWIEVTKEDNE
ncbi:hypothetical protein P4V41_07810 [Fictibacillus nanhaiensis]|uniref:hypothetical protein n=1 Tax=Fictibacillus nanhaiensis TaxID=742169 RepID=UPI002E1E2CAB|nr:hypothetical protein [Fictibacillus nanhaiensis]